MAFTLLVLALALLNEGQAATETILDKADILYYAPGEIDSDNELLIDLNRYELLEKIPLLAYKQYKISKGKPYREGVKITDPSFYMVPKDGFEKKKTSLALNETEKQCDTVTAYHKNGIYAQLGYSLLAKENVDVAPSITYLLANFPKKVTIKAADIEDVVSDLKALTCDIDPTVPIDVYFEYVLHKNGFVGADCIPNTDVPTDTTKCATGAEGQYKKNFEKFKQAVFKGKPDTIKQVLINFGAVRIYDGTVIVGWDAENWVTVVEAPIPVVVTPDQERNVDEDPEVEPDLLPYEYVLGTKPISTWGEVQGFVFNNGFTALRAALGLIAAVLVLPALLL